MDPNPLRGLDRGTYYFFQTQRTFGGIDLKPLMSKGDLLGGWTFLIVIACLIVFLLVARRAYRSCVTFLALVGLAAAINFGVGTWIHKPRPQDAELWHHVARPYGFPCTPALLSSFLFLVLAMVLAATVANRKRKLLIHIAAGAATLFVGFSQLYLGLYYLSDLLAGWTGGVLLAIVADLPDFGLAFRARVAPSGHETASHRS